MDIPQEFWDDPAGRASSIATGVIGTLALLTYVVKKLRELLHEVRVVKAEVKNDHSTNLREEADQRHDENSAKLDRLDEKLETTLELVVNLDRRQGRMWDVLSGRLDIVEDTLNPREQESPWTQSKPAPRPSSAAPPQPWAPPQLLSPTAPSAPSSGSSSPAPSSEASASSTPFPTRRELRRRQKPPTT